MKKLMNKTWLLVLALLMTVVGCQRRPLEVLIGTTARVIIQVQWDVKIDTYAAADPDLAKPTGVTLYIFRDGEFYKSMTTSNVDEIEVQLERGTYKMYLIGQSPEEYWRMEFQNMTDYGRAASRLRENTTATWAARKSGDEVVVENPEILYTGVSEEFEITEKMTEDYQYYYTNLTKLRRAAQNNTKGDNDTKSDDETFLEERVDYYTIRIPIPASNAVSQFEVSIYARNVDLLQALRASTSGMARALIITPDVTDGESAIQMIREWKLVMDDEENRIGHLDGIVTSFGLPGGAVPSPDRDPSLNVSALMVDGSTVADFTFQVGDLIKMLDPTPGYKHLFRLVLGSVEEPAMVLPIVKPEESGGGFTAGVVDWDDEVEADINI